MKKVLSVALFVALFLSCKMENPLLTESTLPYGAIPFDKIKMEHYKPAFEQGIAEMKAEVDAIVANEAEPTFENVIVALEQSGRTFNHVAEIFYNLKEANTNDEFETLAEELSPLMTEASMYVALNAPLFEKIKTVYEKRDELGLEPDSYKLLVDTYKSFARNGANLNEEQKAEYAKLSEEQSLKVLAFSKNALAATKAYVLNVPPCDSARLAGLPEYVLVAAAETAAEKGHEGWDFTLDYPSFGPLLKYCQDRELRKEISLARGKIAVGGEFDNTEIVKDIAELRLKIANLLGYETYADYALEDRMAKNAPTVLSFLDELLEPSLVAARREVKELTDYAHANGFEGELQGWDFSFWSEKLMMEKYAISESLLKPYLRLEDCIDAVFMLANKLYDLTFTPIDLPVYHKDVKVYDVKDINGNHKALFYADFFPRDSKRGGAWMTEFRGQSIVDGVEYRPFISIVTNFSKPTAGAPSLLTHDEFTTFLHEFGHALHGILAEGRYGSQTGTSVARDFVELPSQIMENFAFEPEYLNLFAKHYETGENIPAEYIEKIVAAQNYMAAYYQVGQLRYGILDMTWYSQKARVEGSSVAFEKKAVSRCNILPATEGTAISPAFSHIFAGGYSAGYYSYKWAEVLEADAFSLFKEKGIFNHEVSYKFRDEILSRGSTDDEATLYYNFRGHNPSPKALLKKLGIIK